MRRIFGFVVMLSVVFCVYGCGNVSNEKNSSDSSSTVIDETTIADDAENEVVVESDETEVTENEVVESDEIEVTEKEDEEVLEATVDSENSEETGNIELAREYVNSGEYDKAFREYEKVSDQEMSLKDYHNYAYTLAVTGSGNIEDILVLYDKAYEMGDDEAINNSLAALIYSISEKDNIASYRDLLKKSIEQSNSKVIDYFAAISNKDGIEAINELRGLSDVELIDYLAKNTRHFEDCGKVKFPSTPTSTRTEKFEYVGVYDWYDKDNESAGSEYIYNKYQGTFPAIELLDENLIQ